MRGFSSLFGLVVGAMLAETQNHAVARAKERPHLDLDLPLGYTVEDRLGPATSGDDEVRRARLLAEAQERRAAYEAWKREEEARRQAAIQPLLDAATAKRARKNEKRLRGLHR